MASKTPNGLFCIRYRHHGLHLDPQRATSLRYVRQGGRANSVLFRVSASVVSFGASSRSSRNRPSRCEGICFAKPEATPARGEADVLLSVSTMLNNNRVYVRKTGARRNAPNKRK